MSVSRLERKQFLKPAYTWVIISVWLIVLVYTTDTTATEQIPQPRNRPWLKKKFNFLHKLWIYCVCPIILGGADIGTKKAAKKTARVSKKKVRGFTNEVDILETENYN